MAGVQCAGGRDGFAVTCHTGDIAAPVFGGHILGRGDSKGASGHIQIAITWLIVNVGGGPDQR